MRTSRRRQQRSAVYEDEEDDYNNYYYQEEEDDDYYTTSTTRPRKQGQTSMNDEGGESEENEDDDYYRTTTTTTTEEVKNERRGGIYKVQFERPSTQTTKLDWEAVLDEETGKKTVAWVILPPEDVVRPNAVIHFVGGTFFGSLPQIYYRTLLESLVRNTSCAIVVTPIPVTVLKSPLQHISLGRKLQEALDLAWKVVLQDEYGSSVLSDVPLCGMGHSLGARLLMVLTTLNHNKPKSSSTVVVPPYDSFILMSFTNYGAAAGIPGISTLLQQSKQQEGKRRLQQTTKRRQQARKVNQEWWLDDQDADVDDEEEEEVLDEEWQELVSELQKLVSEQASRVQQALTPNSKDLEFVPSPDQLWRAIQVDDRYKIPKTLLVQFDNDTIDQSAKLAQALQQDTMAAASSDDETPPDETTTTSSSSRSLHFCRLRGEHLSPISVVNDGTNNDDDGTSSSWWKLSTSTTRAIWKSIQGRSKTNRQETVLRELRQSLSSYILDVVTKKKKD